MIVTSRRACAAGAWAAVMLALAVTGPQWAFTPWFAVPALALLTGLGLYALGLLDAHGGHHIAPRRQLNWDEWEECIDAQPRAIEAAPKPEPAYAGHSANWQPDATIAGTDIIDYGGLPAFTPDLGHEPPAGCPEPLPPAPVVTVTDDPPGRHARPRAYLVHAEPPPYCSTCGSGEHWTDGHSGPDPLVTQMVADRAASRAQQAIDASLRERGFKVYPGGEDDAVKSMWTRASGLGLGAAIAAVEEARR